MRKFLGERFLGSCSVTVLVGAGILFGNPSRAYADSPIIPLYFTPNAYAAQAGSQAAANSITTMTQTKVLEYQTGGSQRPGAGISYFAPELGFADDRKSRLEKAHEAYAAVPLRQPAVNPYQWSAWAMGYYDAENHDAVFAGVPSDRRTRGGGGLAGMDVLRRNFTSSEDALLFGIMGGYGETKVRNGNGSTTDISLPGVGVYGAYIRGAFSVDGLFKADFIDQDDQVAGVVTTRGLTNYLVGANINYKIPAMNNWYWEPTVGFTHISTKWDSGAGIADGSSTRLQGGVRFGTQTMWGAVRVQPTLGAYVFSDVAIRGGTQPGAVDSNDEGKVWGKGTAKLNFIVSDRLSWYVEGEIRGASDVVGGAGRLGLRYAFAP